MMRLPIVRNLLLLCALRTGAAGKTTDKVSQQLDISGGGKIVVDVDFGTVDITIGADNHVDVAAERVIDTDSEDREREYISAAPTTVTQEGNIVTVRARRQSGDRGWNHSGHCVMDAHYEVKVPKSFDADLRTGGGSISADGLIGTVKADTSGGKLKFLHLRGALNGKTSGGSIEVKGCDGPLNVATSGGGIDATRGSGRIDARTSGGSIAVQDFSGDATVETSGGSLAFLNVNGNISGRTSGGSVRATLAAPVAGNVKLDTSAGSVDLSVPTNAALTVNADATEGRVSTDLPFVGARTERDSLRATLNGGGRSVELRSGAGSIRIHAVSPDTAHL